GMVRDQRLVARLHDGQLVREAFSKTQRALILLTSAPTIREIRVKHSRQDFANDFAGDVGEAEVAAVEAVGETGVVEAEEVQDGGVEVVDVDGVLDDAPAKVVGLADDLPTFDAAAGHPDAEGEWMMVASGDAGEAGPIFAQGCAA